MHVEHLLQDESLGLRLLWAEDAQLAREISGVTVTDLEDPARFVRRDEVVLSGLVWWSAEDGPGRAERFVSALRGAGAAALLAGEETHGSVPDDLVEACVRHGLPVAAVPAHIMFRAITDTVYLGKWGELSRRHALPDGVRGRLSRMAAQGAGPEAIVATAFAHLERAVAYVLTPSGRTVAATPGAAAISAREATALLAEALPVDADGVSPYERWHLCLPDPDDAPPRMLHELASVLGRCQEARVRSRAEERQTADELGALLAVPGTDPSVVAALRSCGLPEEGPYRVLVAETGAQRAGLAEGALAEVVAHVVAGVGSAAAGGVAGAVSAARLSAGAGAGAGQLSNGPAVAGAVGRSRGGTPVADAVGRSRGGAPGAGAAERSSNGVATAGVGEWASGGAVLADGLVPGAGAVGRLPDGTAFAVVTQGEAEAFREVWSLVAGGEAAVPLYGGTGAAVAEAKGLDGALAQARYALSSARGTARHGSALVDASALTGLDALLTGVPAEVRTAFSRTVLGELRGNAVLLETLETFLACDGSWARTAEALHLHVNSVHYRIGRIEHFTGRDLSRLYDRLDLWAALLCRTDSA
ncbi:helix-turn-helix domain-containing protein [Streptomyces hokutonensis]|uniref:helix-turn-helix domain-containing protein n=2 Tax=Streptomyces TaxID=1883 RepID=UPI000376F34B|nr:PucR family transcriptional regulator [Streptomyces hokutonensis]